MRWHVTNQTQAYHSCICMHHYSNKCKRKYRSHGCTTNARSHTSAFNNARVVIIMIIIVTTNRNTNPNVRNTQEHAAWNAVAGYMTRNTEWEPFRNRDAHARISTHAHALWHCNRSSLIISFINEPATEHLTSESHKSGGKALLNQILCPVHKFYYRLHQTRFFVVRRPILEWWILKVWKSILHHVKRC